MIRPQSTMLARAALLVIASAWMSDDVNAQRPADMPKLSPAERAEASAACDSLATIPNPPMSVQACKAMLGMAGTAERMQSLATDPSARRPGDERLSCDAIFAEMTQLGAGELSSSGSSKAGTAVAEGTALGHRQAAEGATFIAGTYALGAAMGAASPVMPGFVAAAIAYAWQMQAVALGTRQAAEQGALRPRRDEAIIASAEDFENAMTANPRFARLAELGMDKRCEAPKSTQR